MVKETDEFGTNRMTLSLGGEYGFDVFGGIGGSISGALLECNKKDDC